MMRLIKDPFRWGVSLAVGMGMGAVAFAAVLGIAGCGSSSEGPAGDTGGVYNLKVEFGGTWRDCVRLYDHDIECDFTKEATAP